MPSSAVRRTLLAALATAVVACGIADADGDGLASGTPRAASTNDEFSTAKVDGAGAACAAVVAPTEKAKADIVFVIDNSVSMKEEMANIRENVNRFAQRIAEVGVDYRVIFLVRKVSSEFFDGGICVPMPLAGPGCADNEPKFFHVNISVQSINSLDVILATYDGSKSLLGATYDNFGKPIAPWKDRLRPESTKVFVEVTDDESSVTAETFDRALLAKAPAGMFGTAKNRKYVFHSIVSKPAAAKAPSTQRCSTAAGTSVQYQKLSLLTGGLIDEVCKTDYSSVLDNIANRIVDKVGCELEYPRDKATDSTKVVVRATPADGDASTLVQVTDATKCSQIADGWYYDTLDNPSKIVLCPRACATANASAGTKVEALLGCTAPPPR